MYAYHVIFMSCCSYNAHHVLQVWASVISTGPRDYPLNASYKTADAYAFQVLTFFLPYISLPQLAKN